MEVVSWKTLDGRLHSIDGRRRRSKEGTRREGSDEGRPFRVCRQGRGRTARVRVTAFTAFPLMWRRVGGTLFQCMGGTEFWRR